ncbi:hypothetical protein [Mesorhizobium sp. B2-7-2]|uniref:hypothetical protein n=1 Tax=Mesorhizobium sp. B2-7-2 TaxID=2589908 RepID=UPI00112760F2|nr:hypothetical protein [Mesorhizobium sp. B2-7-2]TPJ22657.1 hypothetical protein FJ425_23925 [Mesorhizobium sp. B2-7-2]
MALNRLEKLGRCAAFLLAMTLVHSSSALAATSSEKVLENPRQQYLIFKAAVKSIYIYNTDYGEAANGGYNLVDCDVVSPDHYLASFGKDGRTMVRSKRNEPVAGLLLTAQSTVSMVEALKHAGYPASVADRPIQQFETAAIAFFARNPDYDAIDTSDFYDLLDKFHKQVFSEAEKYRASAKKKLPDLIYLTDCGDGEWPVHVRTIPSNGRVVWIPEFFYRLCKVQKLDPDNEKQCDRWREAPDNIVNVIGDYRYRASWPDGSLKTGALKFANREQEHLTIRKPSK